MKKTIDGNPTNEGMVIKNIIAELKRYGSTMFHAWSKKYEIIERQKQVGNSRIYTGTYNLFISGDLCNDFNDGVSLATIKKWLSCIKKGKEISNYN